eukprot:CAMPEP_0174866696 /NCGR_PEP_ID=MMETSP1114-20130205/62549_1 /TAXON_ID=312471 /ORGANISM="Neobodo designis, Strain CCAP 1951/1" /LENGTH=49 /DNA_ID= /DNA_START= /DNA_END= /DNA_ORIENTATION=
MASTARSARRFVPRPHRVRADAGVNAAASMPPPGVDRGAVGGRCNTFKS